MLQHCTSTMSASHQLLQLRQLSHHVLPVPVPVGAWVAYEVKLLQVLVVYKAVHSEQAGLEGDAASEGVEMSGGLRWMQQGRSVMARS